MTSFSTSFPMIWSRCIHTHTHDAHKPHTHTPHDAHKPHTHTFNIHPHKTQLRHISVNFKCVSANLFISSPKDGTTKNVFNSKNASKKWFPKGVGGFEILEKMQKLYHWEPVAEISDHGEGDYQALPEFVVKVCSKLQIRERGAWTAQERRSTFQEVSNEEPMSKRYLFL